MPLGYDFEKDVTALGDTANLHAWILKDNNQNYSPSEILSVTFTVQYPDGSRNIYEGEITDAGAGSLQFNDTTQIGHYIVVATFTLNDGSIKSTRSSFECQDPFIELNPDPTNSMEAVAQGVWFKLSDIFDSSDGGPWLREMTLQYFNPKKMEGFINEAVFDFNMFQPTSNFTLDDFAMSDDYVNSPNPSQPLIVEGTYLAVVRHLMRSYVEQPDLRGNQVGYEDRRDYQMRWKEIYDLESQMYSRWVSFAKRNLFGFGRMSQSLFSYSRSVWGPQLNRNWGAYPFFR